MNTAIILAGGSGDRMGAMTLPKQFIEIYGKPIVIHTLEVFDLHPEIDLIVVCCKEDFVDDMKIMLRKYNIEKVKRVVAGGKTRKESVFNGLLAIREIAGNDSDTVVVIHDAVRPLLSAGIISDNIKMARECGGADTVIPSGDTIIKSVGGMFLDDIPTRSELFIGQTPQSFKLDVIYDAHINSTVENPTDDCRLVMDNGGKIGLVFGDKFNFKITTQEDLTLLKAVVKLGKIERI